MDIHEKSNKGYLDISWSKLFIKTIHSFEKMKKYLIIHRKYNREKIDEQKLDEQKILEKVVKKYIKNKKKS